MIKEAIEASLTATRSGRSNNRKSTTKTSRFMAHKAIDHSISAKKVIDIFEVVIEEYNDDRPHQALNYQTPNE